MTAAAARRVAGLDAWRAGLMIGGLFYHAIPDATPGVLFALVDYLSSHFRMGAFFAVSGFLTGLVAERRDLRSWVERRLKRLALPLLTGVLITVPAMAILRPHHLHGAVAIAGLFDWYHLWFLVALIAYVPLSAGLAFGMAGERLHGRIIRAAASFGTMQLPLILALGLACFTLLTVGAALMACLPFAQLTIIRFLPLMLCYAPIHAAAILLGRYEDLRHAMLADDRLPWGLLAALTGGELAVALALPGSWSTVHMLVDTFARAAAPALGALLVLRSALAVRHVPRWVAPLCDASMTIYIVHLPLAVLLKQATAGLPVHPYLRYLLVVAVAGALSWAFHAWLVGRSAVLGSLFNGTAPRRATSREAPAERS